MVPGNLLDFRLLLYNDKFKSFYILIKNKTNGIKISAAISFIYLETNERKNK